MFRVALGYAVPVQTDAKAGHLERQIVARQAEFGGQAFGHSQQVIGPCRQTEGGENMRHAAYHPALGAQALQRIIDDPAPPTLIRRYQDMAKDV